MHTENRQKKKSMNIEANSDIYKVFSNLDVSSEENFVDSFAKAIENFKSYYAGGKVQIFTGTDKEELQLDELRTLAEYVKGME